MKLIQTSLKLKNKDIEASFVPMSQLNEHNPYFQSTETQDNKKGI